MHTYADMIWQISHTLSWSMIDSSESSTEPFVFFFFVFLGPHYGYGSSQARGWMRPAAMGLHHSVNKQSIQLGQSESLLNPLKAVTQGDCSECCWCFVQMSYISLSALLWPRLLLMIALSGRLCSATGATIPTPRESWKDLGTPFAKDEDTG